LRRRHHVGLWWCTFSKHEEKEIKVSRKKGSSPPEEYLEGERYCHSRRGGKRYAEDPRGKEKRGGTATRLTGKGMRCPKGGSADPTP